MTDEASNPNLIEDRLAFCHEQQLDYIIHLKGDRGRIRVFEGELDEDRKILDLPDVVEIERIETHMDTIPEGFKLGVATRFGEQNVIGDPIRVDYMHFRIVINHPIWVSVHLVRKGPWFECSVESRFDDAERHHHKLGGELWKVLDVLWKELHEPTPVEEAA